MGDTLGDLKSRDIDNLQFLLDKKQTHVYRSATEAYVAVGEMVRQAALRGGLDLKALMDMSINSDDGGDMVDEAMEQTGVRIETRNYKDPIDKWREGIYVYKNNEILAFIGAVTRGTFGLTVESAEA